jgi:transcriptional regulator with XRE-family HTH domain
MKFSGSQVAAARYLLGLKQEELAEAAGVSTPTLASFEAGQARPHQRSTEKIGQELARRGIEFTNGTGIGVRLDYKKAAEYSAAQGQTTPSSPTDSRS